MDIGDMLGDMVDDETKPPQAADLSDGGRREELERRGLKPTGFPEDDIKLLQKALNAEFEQEREAKIAERREALAKRRAEEEALRMQRFLEKQKREEEQAVANDSRIAFFIELLKSNKTPASMTLRAEPTAIRAFLKEIGASNNRSLKSLDLCGCKLGDDVGIEVGTCLKTNKGLQRLDLDHNQIGPKALTTIAVGLQSNDTLVSLSLEHNPLTGELPAGGSGTDDSSLVDLSGVAALSEALKTNTSVKSLNLFQVGLTQNGGTLVMQAVEGNAHLESVQLSGNDGCDVFDLRRITDKLRANVAAHAAARAAGKQDRAVARKAEAEAEDEAEAKASADAEVAWVERERKEREDRRAALAFEEFRKDRLAQLQRETDEKARQARLKAEAEEKAKKAKKK